MIKKTVHWAHDYLYLIHKQANSFIFKNPPKHYLGHIVEGKNPIILIPGVFEKWNFLKFIVNPLSLKGHPIFVLEHLGYNTREISHSAKLVRELIDEKNLKDIIIISHSKGGLIGKYLLAFLNGDRRIKKVITIATPFGGSSIVKITPHRIFRELSPESEIIKNLMAEKSVNHKIVSIYGIFDNHVWPTLSCNLEGAKNIQVGVYGHHKILFSKKVREIVISEVENND